MYLLSPPSRQKSIKLLSTVKNLFCGNLAYNVENSKVEIEVAFLRLLTLFIKSVVGFSFCIVCYLLLLKLKNLSDTQGVSL